MTIMQQIVTVKVTYDDHREDGCPLSSVENCCGEVCGETIPSAIGNMESALTCCGGVQKVEVLQQTEPREVISEESF